MDKLRSLSVLVALGLAGAAYAQTQTTPGQSEVVPPIPPASQSKPNTSSPAPSSASSPHQRDVTGKEYPEAPPTEAPDPKAASSPHQQEAMGTKRTAAVDSSGAKLVGLEVATPAGESLGSVVDTIMDRGGTPTYVIVATKGNMNAAVPYAAAAPLVANDKLIIDRARLEGAPKVDKAKLRDPSDAQWKSAADRYWADSKKAPEKPNY